VIAKEGAGALLTGFGPTAAGYFLQGAFKFGGYELFKQQSINLLGYETASNNRTGVYLASARVRQNPFEIGSGREIGRVGKPTLGSRR